MNILEKLAQIPIDRLTRYVALALLALFAMEHLEWAQSVVEFLLNMETSR